MITAEHTRNYVKVSASGCVPVGGGRWLSRATVQRALEGLELFTGVTGLVGGLLLIAQRDGSLLQADRSALTGSPFVDWRAPGILLAGLVGGGFLFAGTWQHQRRPLAGVISALGGFGVDRIRVSRVGLDRLPATRGGLRLRGILHHLLGAIPHAEFADRDARFDSGRASRGGGRRSRHGQTPGSHARPTRTWPPLRPQHRRIGRH